MNTTAADIDITTVTCPISRADNAEAAAQWAGLVALYTDHGEDVMMSEGRLRVSLDNAEAFEAEAAELRAAAEARNADDAVYYALHAQAEYLELHARFIRAMADKMGI